MVVGLAGGRYINLDESMALAQYPYSIYNPLGYLPSSILLGFVGLFKPEVLEISSPFLFTPLQNFIARIGIQFWTCLYCFFLLSLVKNFPTLKKVALVVCLAFIPQIIFVQSYVNLDSFGLTVFLYLLWAIARRHEVHIAFGVFLLSCCKMNCFCLLLLPLAYVFWNYRSQKRLLLMKTTCLVGLPFSLLFVWLAFSYWVNTRAYGSFLGFDVLVKLYPSPPSRYRVFTLDFVNLSLASAFGRFGWMNLRLPEFVYFFWRLLILPAAVVYLWRAVKRPASAEAQWIAFTSIGVIFLNLFSHTWFSFNNEYQPQGRYLFPTILILISYLVDGLLREPLNSSRKRWCISLCLFIFLSSIGGSFVASKTHGKPKGLARLWKTPQKRSAIS